MSLLSKENLQEIAAVAQLIIEVKDSAEVQAILQAIPALVGEFKPMLQGFSRFMTQLDIDAVKQMEEAGFTKEHAVALRLNEKECIAHGFRNSFNKKA